MLSGDAKRYHEALTAELSAHFHILPLHERVPAHITVKPPFEADRWQIAEVEAAVRAFVSQHAAPRLVFRGFGRFGFRTVYLDVHQSKDAVRFARDCITYLNKTVPWLPRVPLEGNKLHASVARFLNRRQFRRIWRTLGPLRPHFETHLDNIAILRKDGRGWHLHACIPVARATLPSFFQHPFLSGVSTAKSRPPTQGILSGA